jgi:hypothetical protein
MADDGSERTARPLWCAPWWPFSIVAAVSIVLLIPVHLAFSGDRARASAKSTPESASGVVVACIVSRVDPGYCERRVRDLITRTSLTPEQRSRAESLAAPITGGVAALAHRNDRCVIEAITWPPTPPPCRLERSPLSVDDIRAALQRSGHRDAVVRVARDEDPAPVNSVIYGVHLDVACLLGYVDHEEVRWDIVGQLPGGQCLPT